MPKWKKNRKLIAPTFNQKNLNIFCNVFTQQSLVLIECLKNVTGKDIDLIDFMEKCTLDIVGGKFGIGCTHKLILLYYNKEVWLLSSRNIYGNQNKCTKL